MKIYAFDFTSTIDGDAMLTRFISPSSENFKDMLCFGQASAASISVFNWWLRASDGHYEGIGEMETDDLNKIGIWWEMTAPEIHESIRNLREQEPA